MTDRYSIQGYLLIAFLLLCPHFVFGQTGTLTGTIKDTNGLTLTGAIVHVDGTNLGTATDQNGSYRINTVPAGLRTVTISLLGYQRLKREVSVLTNEEVRLDVSLAEDVLQLSEVAVTATRREEDLSKTPRAVDVIAQETVDFYTNQSSDLAATLGKFVPNFASPAIGNSIFLAKLRGRAPLYLLDGIPLQTNEGFRGAVLGNIDPFNVERVEVLYGASTIYGGGAPGGVIQFFTKEASEERVGVDLQLFSRTYLVEDAFLGGESTDYRTALTVSGTLDKFRYLVNGVVEVNNGQFRPDGQRIAPNGTSAYDDFALFVKGGYDFTPTQSLDFSFNRSYREPNDLFFEPIISDEDVLADPEGAAAIGRRVETAFSYDTPISQTYTSFNAQYKNTDLMGGILGVQGYYFDLNFQQGGSDIRQFIDSGTFPSAWPGLFQTSTDGTQLGARAEYSLPVNDQLILTLGGDYLRAENSTPVTLSTDGPFDAENRFDGAGGVQDQGAPSEVRSGGAFLQADYDVSDELRLSGGVRYDINSFDILPFIPTFTRLEPGRLRLGGSGSNSGFSVNLGAAYQVKENTNVYANFAQGFSLPALGFLVTNVSPDTVISGDEIVSPQIVNSVDIGVRGKLGNNFAYGLATFYAFSQEGSQIRFDPVSGQGERVQAPQRNYGFEATLDAAPAEGLLIGITVAVAEADVDPQDDGTFQPASTIDMNPFTTSLRTTYELPSVPGLSFTAELFTISNRDRAFRTLLDEDNDGEIDLDEDGVPTR
ncbi:MAG: TonB-dependent receptor, partial [Bacteroidota bacterium]